MMEEIEQGNVNCVITKDLSRFGREYIETGRYLRRIFPAYGVRLLAINDNIDTLKDSGDDLSLSLKSIINDAYCRDISIKVRSALAIKRKSGDFVAATAIYGCTKQDDGTWIIDKQAAGVIRHIFDLAKQGLSAYDIADQLKSAGHPMQREHIQITKGKLSLPTCNWKAQNVRNVLSNIQYTGAYVSGSILKDADTGKSYRPSQDEWIIIPDKNPAIISLDLFDEVQAVIAEGKKSRQKNKKPRQFLLRGKVRCGCCDMAMWYDPISNPVFRCHQTIADPSAPCHKLKALVEQRQRHYEQFITGEIDRQAHQSLKADCSAQIDRLNAQLAKYKQSQYDSQAKGRTASHAKTALSKTATEQEIMDMLIEKIHVFPNFHLEITWKVSGFAVV